MIDPRLPTRDQASGIADYIQRTVTADSWALTLDSSCTRNIRSAGNQITSCGDVAAIALSLTLNFGTRSGKATTSDLSPAGLADLVRAAQELALASPENPEFLPPPRDLSPSPTHEYDERTAAQQPREAAEALAPILKLSAARNLVSATYSTWMEGEKLYANSHGCFAVHPFTAATFSITARTADGTGSGKQQAESFAIGMLPLQACAERALGHAEQSSHAIRLPPGNYPVILSPNTASDLLGYLLSFMTRRSADEGRSYFSQAGGKNRIGELIASPAVNLLSDPSDARCPAVPFSPEGLAQHRIEWIKNGTLRSLATERYWAHKLASEPIPMPTNLILEGADGSEDDLIARTPRALYVTNLWYIRVVDPETMLLTGLTRDGLFLVENGAVTTAVKNLRFNESPLEVLRGAEDFSCPMRASGNEVDDLAMLCPAVRTSKFHFSAVSEAI